MVVCGQGQGLPCCLVRVWVVAGQGLLLAPPNPCTVTSSIPWYLALSSELSLQRLQLRPPEVVVGEAAGERGGGEAPALSSQPRAGSPSSWRVEGTPATRLGLMSLPFTAGMGERTSGEGALVRLG